MSSTRSQKRSSSRVSTSSLSTTSNNRSKSQNISNKRTQSPKSKNPKGNSNSKRVQIGTDSYFASTLSPMAPGYLNRRLIKPWRRTDKLECTETQLPTTQIWVQTQQQMYELQALAKNRGIPDTSKEFFSSPYPQ